ncbi:MAG: flagellar hook-basal body protein [Clostridiales bacterium]|nr:flagellar hook-basal body protein [Clostridiales bacterium]
MFKGFYNLTSGMLTQQRHLNVVGNNMVNISTAGFKESRYTATTFDDVMYTRVGNKEKEYTDIGRQSYIRANSEIYVVHDQGIPEPTEIPLDFAIMGEGFFAIQREGGDIVYTRAGSFSLDDEGYLCFPGVGRVLDPNGQTILLRTDKLDVDGLGNIRQKDEGYNLGQLGVYRFEDVEQLEYNDAGFFTGEGAEAMETPQILWKYLERSNVDMIRQMTDMLTCQRALQSAASVTKIYDEVMAHSASDIGRM